MQGQPTRLSVIRNMESRKRDDFEDLTTSPLETRSKYRSSPPTLFSHPLLENDRAHLPVINAQPVVNLEIPGSSSLHPMHNSGSSNGRGLALPLDPHRLGRTLQGKEFARGSDRINILWAEMQATLEEVELSASEGTHVFGPQHDRRLAELRTTQIALAKAWAKSEGDDAVEFTPGTELRRANHGDIDELLQSAIDAPFKSHGRTDSKSIVVGVNNKRVDSTGQVSIGHSAIHDEAAMGIVLSKNRREENDRYFRRVSQGVVEVVERLEDVAAAMRSVEQESRNMWN